jgi:hypothetical protein
MLSNARFDGSSNLIDALFVAAISSYIDGNLPSGVRLEAAFVSECVEGRRLSQR